MSYEITEKIQKRIDAIAAGALEIVKKLKINTMPEPLRLAHSFAEVEKARLKKIL